MPGGPDPLYVLARRVLLDGLEALHPHIDALIVVGAQAVYEHTGHSTLAVAELTTDADVAVAPELLADVPEIAQLLLSRDFKFQGDPGKWMTADGVQFDLLVPEGVAGAGRRGARLAGHGKLAARQAKGLEGALVDNEIHELGAFDPADPRTFRVAVAGPAALLVAKVHKIAERVEMPDRLVDKDALDILRLLRTVPTDGLAMGLARLRTAEVSQTVTIEAIELGRRLLADTNAAGVAMAVRAAGPAEDADAIAASVVALWGDLARAL
jgi:hypothetical protein